MRGLELVHTLLAAAIDDAFAVKGDDVLMAHAELLDQRNAGKPRGARAIDDDIDVLEPPAGQIAGVQKTSSGDNGGAVLVVVENWNVEVVPQSALDDEAFGALDVFEINAAEARTDIADGSDEC